MVPQEISDISAPEDSKPAALNNQEARSDVKEVQQKIIYLTADSEDELTDLKPDETYIIGGIVDHNRYKVTVSSFFFVNRQPLIPLS
jgi:tRNA (guanine9-N1)-methyltransferase